MNFTTRKRDMLFSSHARHVSMVTFPRITVFFNVAKALIESRVCFTQMMLTPDTERSQLIFGIRSFEYSSILFLGWSCSLFMSFHILLHFSTSDALWSSLFLLKSKTLPRYVNPSFVFTGGITAPLVTNLGEY